MATDLLVIEGQSPLMAKERLSLVVCYRRWGVVVITCKKRKREQIKWKAWTWNSKKSEKSQSQETVHAQFVSRQDWS